MTRCYVCSHEAGNQIVQAKEKMFGMPGDFSYLECSSCGHVQILEVPSNLGAFYPTNYYSYQPQGKLVGFLKRKRAASTFGEPSLLGAILRRVYGRPPIKEWFDLVSVRKSDRILDLGCGSGLIIRELSEAGFSSITGADPFIEKEISFGSIRVLKKAIDQLEGPFDFIMMNHSFEHMPDPKHILRETKRILAPGGKVLIRVPVIGMAWRRYRENWVSLDAPRHLFIPSKRSLGLMAEEAGLKLLGQHYDSNAFQFWASEQYQRNMVLDAPTSYKINPKRSLFSADDIARFAAEAKKLNEAGDGDQAGFIFGHAGEV